MKRQAYKHHIDVTFQGDMTFVKLQPSKQASVAGDYHKLSKKFSGPFRLCKKVRMIAYEVELPEYIRIHNNFHVSCLKQARGSIVPSVELPLKAFDNNLILESLCVLDPKVS